MGFCWNCIANSCTKRTESWVSDIDNTIFMRKLPAIACIISMIWFILMKYSFRFQYRSMCIDADGRHLLAFVSILPHLIWYYQVPFLCLCLCIVRHWLLSHDDIHSIDANSFSWLCCFMAQMNPLMGPRLHQGTLLMVAREWGNMPYDFNEYVPDESPSQH